MFLKFEEFLSESIVNEALDATKIEKSLTSSFNKYTSSLKYNEEVSILKTPIRIESDNYSSYLKKRAKSFKASIAYIFAVATNEDKESFPQVVIISRLKGTTRIFDENSEAWDKYSKSAKLQKTFKEDEIGNSEFMKLYLSKAKEITAHLKKFPRDGSAK